MRTAGAGARTEGTKVIPDTLPPRRRIKRESHQIKEKERQDKVDALTKENTDGERPRGGLRGQAVPIWRPLWRSAERLRATRPLASCTELSTFAGSRRRRPGRPPLCGVSRRGKSASGGRHSLTEALPSGTPQPQTTPSTEPSRRSSRSSPPKGERSSHPRYSPCPLSCSTPGGQSSTAAPGVTCFRPLAPIFPPRHQRRVGAGEGPERPRGSAKGDRQAQGGAGQARARAQVRPGPAALASLPPFALFFSVVFVPRPLRLHACRPPPPCPRGLGCQYAPRPALNHATRQRTTQRNANANAGSTPTSCATWPRRRPSSAPRASRTS